VGTIIVVIQYTVSGALGTLAEKTTCICQVLFSFGIFLKNIFTYFQLFAGEMLYCRMYGKTSAKRDLWSEL